MNNATVNNITPFIPAKDYELSLRFYNDLGFTEIVKLENSIRLQIDGNSFWLQDYYVKDWADNTMLCIYVDDLDAWWSMIRELNVNDSYGSDAKILSEPHQQEGGSMMQFTDPSGVLWHVREGA